MTDSGTNDSNDLDVPIEEGISVTPALLGIPTGGLVRLWTSPQESSLWQVDEADFEELVVLLGSGAIARTFPVNGRTQEAGMFHAESGLLLLQNGEPVDPEDLPEAPEEGQEMPEFGTSFFSMDPADPDDATAPEAVDEAWAEIEETITQVVIDSFARGELVVLEPIGYTPEPGAEIENPYVLIGLAEQEGEIHVMIEGSPAPQRSDIWPASDDPRGATLTAPANDDSVNVTGSLAVDACKEWGVTPWDLIITYVDPAEAFADPEEETPDA